MHKATSMLRALLLAVLFCGPTPAFAQYSQSMTATAISTTRIDVYWMQLPGFLMRNDGSGWVSLGFKTASGTIPDTGLTPGTTYTYYLAYQCDENGCLETNHASATTFVLPAAPSGLGAAAASATQVNLSWTDNSSNETGFKIERKTGAGGTYSEITTTSANATTYNNTGLSASTTYYYRVRATGTGGDSSYTSEVSVTTLTVAPTNLNATSAAGPQANLTWTDNSSDETGFKIERKTGAGGTWGQINTAAANATSYSDTTVTGGNVYYYRVRAYTASGDSAYSNEPSISFVVPAAPSGLSARNLTSAGQVRLTWADNSSEETGFKVERKTGAGGTYSEIGTPAANAVSYDDSGLTVGTIYYYRVRATNTGMDSSYSNEVGISAASATTTTGQQIDYAYDAFGNLVSTTVGGAGGVETTMTYDIRGRKTQMVDPTMGTWSYRYNALGELVWQCDPLSRAAASSGSPAECTSASATQMAYDKLGRMTSRTERDLVSNWYFDFYKGETAGTSTCTKGIGKLCEADSPTGSGGNGYNRKLTYDSLGRLTVTAITVDSTTYSSTMAYVASGDHTGKLDTLAYPGSALTIKHEYNARGYLTTVKNNADSSVIWQVTSVHASGGPTGETLGNSLTVTRSYDSLERPTSIVASSSMQNMSYTYDAIGNVTQRVDSVNSITDSFAYDSLNRLTSSSGNGLMTRSWSYDAKGNVLYKSDVGVYTYSGTPYAVSSVGNSGAANSITASYSYDANGNLTAASGTIYPASGSLAFSRALTYTSYNTPTMVCEGRGSGAGSSVTGSSCSASGDTTNTYTYTYSVEHERVKLVTDRSTDGTHTSIYIHPGGKGALLYEKEVHSSSGVTEHKHYVNGAYGVVAVYVTKSSYGAGEGPEMRYFHRDHLGSIVRITSPSAASLESFAYEAFGERRYPAGTQQDRSSPLLGVTSDRGFTAHEHLDELNLIHMNGRIYDPALARFMTADPFIASGTDLQSYNRYTYVNNNPLAYTDPSGYFKLGNLFKAAAIVAAAVYLGPEVLSAYTASIGGTSAFGYSIVTASGSLGISLSSTGLIASGAIGGFGAGLIGGGTLESGLHGAVGGALFGWAGTIGAPGDFARYAAHAGAGCLQGELGGGGCGRGALSAVAGKFATNVSGRNPIAAVVAGGTASVLGGGRFANGAVTASFGYLFNCIATECFAQGRDAEATFRGFLNTSGATAEWGLNFNRFYDSDNNPFFGFPDIYSERLRMVWDVKPDSDYGWGSGELQIGMYTATGVYAPGAAAPLFGTRDSVTLTGTMNRYEFRYGGNGLVIYRALDASPMERSLGRAFQRQAAPALFGPPRRREGLLFQ